MPNALIAPGGVVDRRRRPLTPQEYELIQAYRGRPVSLDVLGPPPTTMETVGALAPLAGAAVMAPSLPLALATIPAYHAITSGALSNLPSIPSMPGEPWATLSDFVLGMGGGGPGAYNRAAVIRRPSPGWKSTLKGLVEAKLPAKATPEQLEAIARYAPKEEVQYVNLSDLAGGPLRKEDVLRTIERRNVPLEETLRTEGDVKYRSRSTPGGEDYRELLLRLPNEAAKRIAEIEAEQKAIRLDPLHTVRPAMRDRLAALESEKMDLQVERSQLPEYRSSHWQEPNVLAHTRLNTFMDPQGKKVLLVDEIQSDWHQTGREKGYQPTAEQKAARLAEINAELDAIYRTGLLRQNPPEMVESMRRAEIEPFNRDMLPDEIQRAQALMGERANLQIGGTAVPDAPFKREWHELAFKRALREAAETGAEKMAWTTGEQQAQRYDLSKHIGEVRYDPELQQLYAMDPNGRQVIFERDVTPKDLDQYLGAELGERMREKVREEYNPVSRDDFSIEHDPEAGGYVVYDANGEPLHDRGGDLMVFKTEKEAQGEVNWQVENDIEHYPTPSLRGLDLKVGGEGMKGFYDQILPQFANKYLKQFGLKTGETALSEPRGWELWIPSTGEVVESAVGLEPNTAQSWARIYTRQRGIEHEARPMKAETFHSIEITPELREFLMRGQPLFGSKK